MKLKRCLDDPFVTLQTVARYDALGLEFVENTEEDILDLVLDHYDLRNEDPDALTTGVFSRLTPQQREISAMDSRLPMPYSIIGKRFLDKHPELL